MDAKKLQALKDYVRACKRVKSTAPATSIVGLTRDGVLDELIAAYEAAQTTRYYDEDK